MFSLGAKAVMGTGTKILIGLAITGWLALYVYGQGVLLEKAEARADKAEKVVVSLRGTLRTARELAEDRAVIIEGYTQEVQDARAEAELLQRCLADGTCGLRVAATCVRVDGTGAAVAGADAGTVRLDPGVGQDYSALQQGLKEQRAQVIGLQKELRALHGKCKLFGE